MSTVEIRGTFLHATVSAVLIMVDGAVHWIPHNLVPDCEPDDYDRGDAIELDVPEWFATKEGLI